MVIDLTKNKRFHLTNTQSIFLPDFPWPKSLGRNLLAFQGLGRISVHLSVCLWIGLCSTSSCCSITWSAAWASEGPRLSGGGGEIDQKTSCFCWFLSIKPYTVAVLQYHEGWCDACFWAELKPFMKRSMEMRWFLDVSFYKGFQDQRSIAQWLGPGVPRGWCCMSLNYLKHNKLTKWLLTND